jgi:ketosteroid isomerase-like protein
VTHADVQRWLDAYLEAWKSYDPDAIGALFSDDVAYRCHPYDEPITGRETVVASWLGEGDHAGASARDEPGTYDGSYRPAVVEGDLAVAVGTSTYFEHPGGQVTDTYDNCWVIRFDAEGRCREFTEWYMTRPLPEAPRN